jgi:carboxylesterase
MPQLIPTAEPFFFPGEKSAPGCLLVHGFTGTPKEMRWMGEYLAGQGFHALGVRLAGHATRPQDMVRSRYTDWTASLEDGYHLLRGHTGRVYLVGLSMGGLLSLRMAARLDVAGVVVMSTPCRLPGFNYPVWFLKAASIFLPFMPKDKRPPGAGWYDQEAYHAHISYPMNTVRSAAELKLLMAEVQAALPEVKAPVLLVHSRNDDYVPKDSMPCLYERLGSADKTMLWVEGSGHVIPREPPRLQVFQAAAGFIRRVEKDSAG